jgi:hypothetical protein
VFSGPLYVVADEQVEEPVAIEINPQGRGAEAHAPGKAARSRDVDERALAGVAEQSILADAGHEDVGIAVVVPVPDCHAHPIELDIESCRTRDVRERAVAIVAIQAKCRTLPFVPRPIHPVDEQNVLPAIGVVIQKGATRAQGLRKKLAPVRTAVVLELKTGRTRDVGQTESECRLCLRGRTSGRRAEALRHGIVRRAGV